jgi:hypothetical protein
MPQALDTVGENAIQFMSSCKPRVLTYHLTLITYHLLLQHHLLPCSQPAQYLRHRAVR